MTTITFTGSPVRRFTGSSRHGFAGSPVSAGRRFGVHRFLPASVHPLFLRYQSYDHPWRGVRQSESRARPGRVLQQHIEQAIGSGRDGADAAELFEHGLLVDHLSSADFKAAQLLPGQRARVIHVLLAAWIAAAKRETRPPSTRVWWQSSAELEALWNCATTCGCFDADGC